MAHEYFRQRIMAFALAAIMTVSLIPARVQAEGVAQSVTAQAAPGLVQPYVFKWGDDDLPRDTEEVCYYADSFFDGSATEYNPSLATASVCLAMASGASIELGTPIDYSKQDKNGIAFLSMLGFENPQSNPEFKSKPTLDSIGCVVGHKAIGSDGTVLVAVGVRGCNYMAEWGGNFTIGSDATADHAGFDSAAQKVVDFVSEYIDSDGALKNTPDNKLKIWIAGYSRAAATSNLAAAKMVRSGVCGKALPKENIYAYTFETPCGGLRGNRFPTDYGNIFNIVNAHDLVPMVAPAAYGFGQYGINKILPTKETDADYIAKRDIMLSRYSRAAKYSLDDFKSYKFAFNWPPVVENKNGIKSQAVFMDGFVNNLAKVAIGDRDKFHSELESPFRSVIDLLMGQGNLTADNAKALMKRVGYNLLTSPDVLIQLYMRYQKGDWTGIEDILIQQLQKAGNELKLTFDANALVKQHGPQIVKLVLKLFISAPNWFVTLIKDSVERSGITQAHSLLLAKTWLETMDPCYVPDNASRLDPKNVFMSGEYRLVRIASNYTEGVKAEVIKDDSGANVLTITDNEQSGSGVTAGFSTWQEIAIYLPTNAEYTVRVTGIKNKNDVKFQYSVSEYNPTVEADASYERIKRICFWSENSIRNGETYIGYLPAFTEQQTKLGVPGGSSCAYTLTGSNGTAIAATSDKKAAELNAYYCNIAVNEDIDVYGGTWGAGTYLIGTNVCVHAMPITGGRFVGWYDTGDNLLSEELEYAFPLLDTVSPRTTIQLKAKFGCNLTPQNVKAENAAVMGGSSQINVTWEKMSTAELLDDRIAGYEIYRDGSLLATVTGADMLSYMDGSVTAGQRYVYTVLAYDKDNSKSERSTPATVTAGAPCIQAQTLPDGAENADYGEETLAASGIRPVSWSIVSGSLPTGLRLSNDGKISGRAASAGTFEFTVRASNAYGYDDAERKISVRALSNRPVIKTVDLPNAVESDGNFTPVQLDALGLNATWSLESGSLPDGLALSRTGIISGKATRAGVYRFTVKASNEFGSDSRSYTMLVVKLTGAPVISTYALPNGTPGSAYDVQIDCYGLDPIRFTIVDGALPGGLTLDEETGRITGTLASGTYTFTVCASNTLGMDERRFTISTDSGGSSSGAYDGGASISQYALLKNGVWLADGSLCFELDADCERFISVSVDGVPLEHDAYTVKCGSTIITLKASYLSTLKNGEHRLRIQFTDGRTDTVFTIGSQRIHSEAIAELPATGGFGASAFICLGLCLCSVAWLTCSFVIAPRRKPNKFKN